MNNFFSSGQNENKSTLNNQYDSIKDNYEKIFLEAVEIIRKEVGEFKPENPCVNCSVKDCKIEKKDVFTKYPDNCEYRSWQIKIISFLTGDYKQKLKNNYKEIMNKKNEYKCDRCAACCKLATSPYSYNQLKQRAMKGDKFSEDFVSVFVPYDSDDLAKEANPEYFELLNRLVEDEKIYYYYCPKMKDNLCTIYEKRPDICKEFPHNPLKLLPSSCSYNEWKNSVTHQSMLLKAKVDIIEYYKEKLQ